MPFHPGGHGEQRHGGSCANLADYFAGSLAHSPYAVLWLLSRLS